jgi:hypothetical protein
MCKYRNGGVSCRTLNTARASSLPSATGSPAAFATGAFAPSAIAHSAPSAIMPLGAVGNRIARRNGAYARSTIGALRPVRNRGTTPGPKPRPFALQTLGAKSETVHLKFSPELKETWQLC